MALERVIDSPAGYFGHVFERFSLSARQVVVLAQDEARSLRHNYIGTEHILLGLLREGSIGGETLEALGVSLDEARERVERIVGEGDEHISGQIPFTPRGKKVLELALRRAQALGHDYIGSEHILLGLVQEGEGVAVRILGEFGLDAGRIDAAVTELLEHPSDRPSKPPLVASLHPPLQPLDVVGLVLALEEAKQVLLTNQRLEDAAALRERQRDLQRLVREIESDLRLVGATTPPRPSLLREYGVKDLDGASDTWPAQLSGWHREGWELLAIVPEAGKRRAVLERRAH
jgi:ATP-dependent Clp protease ATP-binding subunit ClpA